MKIKTEMLKNDWKLFELSNDNGMKVNILNYGGIITNITVPDRNGKPENIVLGYKNYEDYVQNPVFLGAIIGRVAGRIADAEFSLNGEKYELEKNDGENHLHGGSEGFHQAIWDARGFQSDTEAGVELSLIRKEGEDGYPGSLDVKVTYTLTDSNRLQIDYQADTDKTTALTLTNHSYFNLTGDLKRTVHDHQVKIDSSKFVELDDNLIPTGRQLDTSGTTFDFREERNLSEGFNSSYEQNKIAGNGYDHYFIFDREAGEKVTARDEASGRKMVVETDQPGMVMYTSNSMDSSLELAERASEKYLGVCFETQGSPASLQHESFPEIILQAGETYKKKTVFTFLTED
ncbi:aldose epimerase family protein [Evansella clarkii]|uniref:aldose epimerase family protein n=1 Tax=Evansella clarkii TaxID=79879 RepID=UPI000B4445C7|nr:aldose epimerase family protein [Evansella clarkii]